MSKNKTNSLAVRLSDEDYNRLNYLSEVMGMSRAGVVRLLIRSLSDGLDFEIDIKPYKDRDR